MGNMYDKLGDFLNEALEKGEIPSKNKTESDAKQETEIPSYIQTILNILKIEKSTQNQPDGPADNTVNENDLLYGYSWKEITVKYHELLRKLHPDTQSESSVYVIYEGKQLDINTLQEMYKNLSKFFKNS